MDLKNMSNDDWKKKLTPEQYHVLREQGTEYPFTGKYLHHNDKGEYACAACAAVLFASDSKYESDIPTLVGWPSFASAAGNDAVELRDDYSYGMRRVEVTCKKCGGHLGHVFDDDSSPSGKHFCISSVALDFKKK